MPISLVAIGYYDEIKKRDKEFDTNKVHFNKW